jgi:hypothetical protein
MQEAEVRSFDWVHRTRYKAQRIPCGIRGILRFMYRILSDFATQAGHMANRSACSGLHGMHDMTGRVVRD